jgi:hypothetical protein
VGDAITAAEKDAWLQRLAAWILPRQQEQDEKPPPRREGRASVPKLFGPRSFPQPLKAVSIAALEEDALALRGNAKQLFKSATSEVMKALKFRGGMGGAADFHSLERSSLERSSYLDRSHKDKLIANLDRSNIDRSSANLDRSNIDRSSANLDRSVSTAAVAVPDSNEQPMVVEVVDGIGGYRSVAVAVAEERGTTALDTTVAEGSRSEADRVIALLSSTQSAVAQSLLILNNLEVVSKEVR